MPERPSRAARRLALAAGLLLAAAALGCGAYFNTYYNAVQAYRKGEKTLEGSGAKTARTSYDDCLKISSKLLQFYPESRWVDDTILLIGQCYMRLDQHHRALRKFDELQARFPDSPLVTTARIWRARAFLALGREDDCLGELAGLDLDALERGERVEALRAYVELFRAEDARERLLETQERLLRATRRRADQAAIHADMAAVLEEDGRWEEALRHYNAVRRHKPGRALLLRSWLGHLDNNLRLGRLDGVERRLRKLGRDERFYEERHALDLRRGWLRERRGDHAGAMSDWASILKDFPRTESAAGAAYALGRIFLHREDQLDSARVYLKRASQEKSGSTWADSSAAALLLLESLDKAGKEVDRLDGLIRDRRVRLDPDSARLEWVRSQLPRLRAAEDSLRARREGRDAGGDSLARAPGADSLAQALTDSLARSDSPPRSAVAGGAGEAVAAGRAEADSLGRERAARRGGGRRNLFDFQRREREAARADSLRQAQVADSLRLSAEREEARLADSLLVAAVLDTLTRRPDIDSLRLMSEADSLSRLRFDQSFYLAEVSAGALQRPDRADSLMDALLREPAATPEQAARLHYAYGALRLDQFADTSGLGWMRRLVEKWPSALAANAARDRLGLPRALTLEDSAAVMLAAAERLWLEEGDALAARRAYLELAERFAAAPQAATALLAAGTIAWDDLERPDLGAEAFRRFLRDYPKAPGADQVRRRLGQAVAVADTKVPAAPREDAQTVATVEALTDESGSFVDPDRERPAADRLQDLRDRFRELGRLRLEQILE